MTHCDRLLAALADGREHTHHELYGLHMIVHSRVADLRRKGYTIEQRRRDDVYLYRLVGTPEEGAAATAGTAAPSSDAPTIAVPPDDGASDSVHDGQLCLEVAA